MKPKHTLLGEMAFILFGVSAFAVAANANEQLGKTLLILMLGWLMVWLMIHSDLLNAFIGRLQNLGGQQ